MLADLQRELEGSLRDVGSMRADLQAAQQQALGQVASDMDSTAADASRRHRWLADPYLADQYFEALEADERLYTTAVVFTDTGPFSPRLMIQI